MFALITVLLFSLMIGQVPLMIYFLIIEGLEFVGILNKTKGKEKEDRMWGPFAYILQVGGIISSIVWMIVFDVGDVKEPIIGFFIGMGYLILYASPIFAIFGVCYAVDKISEWRRNRQLDAWAEEEKKRRK